MPAWSQSVARATEAFLDTILVVQEGPDMKRYYKFLYAVISPCYVALCPATPLPFPAPDQLCPHVFCRSPPAHGCQPGGSHGE
eukprot:6388148-Lingulodinium_polyedra.AAC.1